MTKTLFFTGHRPKSFANDGEGWFWAYNELAIVVERAYKNGFNNFITGGALGWDQAAFTIVWGNQKLKRHRLKTIVAVPFPSQPKLWSHTDREMYLDMLKKADTVKIVSEDPYHVRKMHVRNQWMANQSQACIACLRGGLDPVKTRKLKKIAKGNRVMVQQ